MNIEQDGDDCLPEAVEREDKHHSADINCLNCNQTDCFYWVLYNLKNCDDK